MRNIDSSRRIRRSTFGAIRCLALFLCVSIIPFLSGLLPIARFTEERIAITVCPDHVRVRGTYVYDNHLPFPVIQGLTVPLPIDRDNPAPVMLHVTQLRPVCRRLPVRCLLGEYRCEISVPARCGVTVMVEYIQYAPNDNAHYLLTTTGPWRRPVERGVFSLTPEGVEILNSTYPLVPADTGMLFFQRKDFMPTQDWNFSWKTIENDET